MTKKQYLYELSLYLRFRLPYKEVSDIMADMRECFESGEAEGRREDEICAGLGSPRNAAREIISGREAPMSPKERAFVTVPIVICALSSAVFVFAAGRNFGAAAFLMLILPPVIWSVCERKNLFRSLCDYAAEISDIICPLCLTAGAALVYGFVMKISPLDTGHFYYSDKSYPAFSVLIVLLVMISMTACGFFGRKKGEKIFPALCAAVCVSAVIVFIYSYCNVYSVGVSSEAVFYGRFGSIIRLHQLLIASALICCIAHVIARPGAYSISVLYLDFTAAGVISSMHSMLRRMDPMGDLSIELAIIYKSTAVYICVGIILSVVSAAVIFFYRKKHAGR